MTDDILRGARRPATIVPAVALALAGLGACSPVEQAETCVSWVEFATPADAVRDAEYVVTAQVQGRAGRALRRRRRGLVGADDGPAGHRGEAVGHEDLRVISTPFTCTGGENYPDGDPLDTDDPVILFLTRDEAGEHWRTITPMQGALPASDDGELPEAWPGQ